MVDIDDIRTLFKMILDSYNEEDDDAKSASFIGMGEDFLDATVVALVDTQTRHTQVLDKHNIWL